MIKYGQVTRHPNITSHFVVRSHRAPDESFLGYFLRLSALNGFQHPRKLLLRSGQPDSCFLKTAVLVIERERYLSQSAVHHQMPIRIRKSSGCMYTVRYQGHVLPFEDVRLRNPKICPFCVHEDGFIRAEWDLTLWLACPVHKVFLQNMCSVCRTPLIWMRPTLSCCHNCGADFREQPGSGAPASILNYTALLAYSINGRANHDLPPSIRHKFLGISLPTLLLLCKRLGAPVHRNQTGHVGAAPKADALKMVMTFGEFFEDWPTAFYMRLDELSEQLKDTSWPGLGSRFSEITYASDAHIFLHQWKLYKNAKRRALRVSLPKS